MRVLKDENFFVERMISNKFPGLGLCAHLTTAFWRPEAFQYCIPKIHSLMHYGSSITLFGTTDK